MTTLDSLPRLYSLKEVSEQTGFPVTILRRWVQQGKLQVVRPFGGHPRVTADEVQRVLKSA